MRGSRVFSETALANSVLLGFSGVLEYFINIIKKFDNLTTKIDMGLEYGTT
jgi:hypothetical protein